MTTADGPDVPSYPAILVDRTGQSASAADGDALDGDDLRTAPPDLVRETLARAATVGSTAGASRWKNHEALNRAADAVVALGAEGELSTAAVEAMVGPLADSLCSDLEQARLALFSRTISSSRLLELPPLVAAGLQLRLLTDLQILEDISLWRRSPTGDVECSLSLGLADAPRRVRAEAKALLRGRDPTSGRSLLRSAVVRRHDQVIAVVVGQAVSMDDDLTATFLNELSRGLAPVLEREALLERSRAREQALATLAERRLTRLAFDLHDGPIQDVLALAADVRHLQLQLHPFVQDSHQELAFGRFEDLTARLGELDRMLREVSHSLESKSIVGRPLGEILHREVDAFADRTGVAARLELRGDPESLDSAQRIVVFRATQEALANVREHSGASAVEIRLWARRGWIEVRVVDNGTGFEVSRALARAAKRGRLGLVGIGERVRLLGGTLSVDSRPGGPTTLSFTLPR